MQKTIFLLTLICLLATNTIGAQVKKKLKYYELDINRGLFFQPNTMDPWTGMAYDEHPNGKKKLEASIKDGKLHGFVREWARNGQKIYETTYEMGVQTDKETQWYANGVKSLEIGYKNGEPDGICYEWHKNEQPKSEGLFRQGKEEGLHQWWFEQGQKDQVATFVNGKMTGLTQNWHPNGNLKLETPYTNGLRDGQVKEYYKSGQLKMQGTFTADVKDKEHLFYSPKGFLIGKKIYDNGTLKQDFNYRSGNIKTSDGYIQVFNQANSFYKLPITGKERVSEGKDPINIIYAVDGMLLQLYDVPLSSTVQKMSVGAADILMEMVKEEQAFLQKDTTFPIDIQTEAGTTENGIPYVYWWFKSPHTQDEEQKPRTPQSEHYVSLLCNQQVLNLYSIVSQSDEVSAVEAMLKRLANDVILESERIDLNEIARSVR